MSTPETARQAASADPAPARLIETNGIDIIREDERTAKPRDLFWPWFAANVSVFGMSYAAFVYGFGVSFGQAVFVAVVGVIVSFALCGVIAIAGKKGSVPTTCQRAGAPPAAGAEGGAGPARWADTACVGGGEPVQAASNTHRIVITPPPRRAQPLVALRACFIGGPRIPGRRFRRK